MESSRNLQEGCTPHSAHDPEAGKGSGTCLSLWAGLTTQDPACRMPAPVRMCTLAADWGLRSAQHCGNVRPPTDPENMSRFGQQLLGSTGPDGGAEWGGRLMAASGHPHWALVLEAVPRGWQSRTGAGVGSCRPISGVPGESEAPGSSAVLCVHTCTHVCIVYSCVW